MIAYNEISSIDIIMQNVNAGIDKCSPMYLGKRCVLAIKFIVYNELHTSDIDIIYLIIDKFREIVKKIKYRLFITNQEIEKFEISKNALIEIIQAYISESQTPYLEVQDEQHGLSLGIYKGHLQVNTKYKDIENLEIRRILEAIDLYIAENGNIINNEEIKSLGLIKPKIIGIINYYSSEYKAIDVKNGIYFEPIPKSSSTSNQTRLNNTPQAGQTKEDSWENIANEWKQIQKNLAKAQGSIDGIKKML